MSAKDITLDWFEKWESGDFLDLPLAEDFKHSSPFGTTYGKSTYLAQVDANKDKFLGYTFNIQDAIYAADRSCVRYVATQDDFELKVSEWHYIKNGLIKEIIAYYHIGEIREERQLKDD